MGHHERSDPVVDLQDLRRQVRWCRHAVERLIWCHGVAFGLAGVWLVYKALA